MNQNLMSLGEHYFFSPRLGEASPGFQTIERDSNFVWAAQQRLSRAPALQFTGPGMDTIQIEGRLYPHLFGGLKTLEAMRDSGYDGKVLMMARYYVLSDPVQYVGERIGKYVMTRLRKRELKIGGDGLPLQLEFSIELNKFGDDKAKQFEYS